MFTVNVNHHNADKEFQANVLGYLKALYEGEKRIMATLQDLKSQVDALNAKVTAETTLEKSLETLLTGIAANQKALSDQLAAALANSDPVAVQAVADSLSAASAALDANIADMTAAVAANTPAAS